MIRSPVARLASGLVLSALLAGCGATQVAAPSPTTVVEAQGRPPGDRIDALRARFLDPDGPVMVVAHRACWKAAPENSLAAIRDCLRLGVDMIELDVQRTRDGHLVLMHDATVNRTTDGAGRVADLTLAQVKALRLRAGAGGPDAPLTDQSPPTFAEAMAAARGAMLVNVDAKGEVNLQAVQELERLGQAGQALIKSAAAPDDPALAAVLAGRELLFMPILREADGADLATAPDRYRPAPPAYEITFVTEAYFQAGAPILRARGARVWVNTLQPLHAAGHVDAGALADPDAVWGRLTALGANIVQTDEPEALIAWLARR